MTQTTVEPPPPGAPEPGSSPSLPPFPYPGFRGRVHAIIFRHGEPAERAFDVFIIAAIFLSVAVVMLDSVAWIHARHGATLFALEWFFTVLFTVEYLLRVWSAERPRGYATSFYGLVDLLAILPTYVGAIFPTGRFLVALRILRVLRVFRILKLVHYVEEASVLGAALRASRFKIIVFLTAVLSAVTVVGSLMYLIEGEDSGFTSIPQSVYWAIVTITTVGYGDVAPVTGLGKMLATALMITGYGIIAVPTGIVTLELDRASREPRHARSCPSCGAARHERDAQYCRHCGTALPGSP